jgi:Domain of unknown function (DUF4460)
MLNVEEKRLIRAVMRRVHPDLFAAHPFERARNSESLKVKPPTLAPSAVVKLDSLIRLPFASFVPVWLCPFFFEAIAGQGAPLEEVEMPPKPT